MRVPHMQSKHSKSTNILSLKNYWNGRGKLQALLTPRSHTIYKGYKAIAIARIYFPSKMKKRRQDEIVLPRCSTSSSNCTNSQTDFLPKYWNILLHSSQGTQLLKGKLNVDMAMMLNSSGWCIFVNYHEFMVIGKLWPRSQKKKKASNPEEEVKHELWGFL